MIFFDNLLPEEIEKYKDELLVTFFEYKIKPYQEIYKRNNLIFVDLESELGSEIFESLEFR